MIVKISEAEWFPVYVENEHGLAVEVPSEIIERWRAVLAEFSAIQDAIEKLYEPVEKEMIRRVQDASPYA